MKRLLTTTAAGLLAAGAALAVAADAAAQGSTSQGGTSSRGTGGGTPSMTAPPPGTPQPGTVSPGTSLTGTTSQGDRPGDTTGGTIGSTSPTERAPAPTIIDRGTGPGTATRGRGTSNLATLPPAQIQSLQAALNRAGIAVAVDGQAGPETQRALQQYQRDNGLPVTGELDEQTRARLDVGG
jgi:hypothetical protein